MAGRVDRTGPPAPGSLAPFRFPPFVRLQLANGIQVVAARSDAAPLAGATVLMRAGGCVNPLTLPGLASLHAGLLDEGTGHLDALAIARRIEQLGGSLGTAADWDVAALQIGLLDEHLDEGLALLADVLFDARFPVAEIERAKRQRLAELLRRRDQPSALAGQCFARAAYAGTVYEHPMIGTEASIEAIDRDRLRAFYRHHVVTTGLTVVVVGNAPIDQLRAAVEARFGAIAPAPLPPPATAIQPPAAQRRVIVVDRPGAAQTQLQLGHPSVPRREPGYPARVLLNAIFGGTFTSRLNLSLREKHGITYGVRSSFVRRTGPGPFVVRASIDTGGAGLAVGETLDEMARIRAHGVTCDELHHAQQFLIGVFPYTVETVGDLASRVEDLVVFDLPDNYYDSHPARLGDVTADDVQEAACRFFDPDATTIVAVGPATDLEPQLAPFGDVEIVRPDDRNVLD